MIFILSVIVVLIIAKHSEKYDKTDPSFEKYNNTPDDAKLTYNEWYSLYYDNKPYNLPESKDEERITKDDFELFEFTHCTTCD